MAACGLDDIQRASVFIITSPTVYIVRVCQLAILLSVSARAAEEIEGEFRFY